MAEVTVTIAGRNYRMACDDGQEDHLLKLGDVVDQKISDMRASFGEIGDMRLTVMATIVVADELSESKRKIAALEDKLALQQSADQSAAVEADTDASEAAEIVDHLAERLEMLAADLRARLKAHAGAEGG